MDKEEGDSGKFGFDPLDSTKASWLVMTSGSALCLGFRHVVTAKVTTDCCADLIQVETA